MEDTESNVGHSEGKTVESVEEKHHPSHGHHTTSSHHEDGSQATNKWLLAASVIQVVLLLYIAVQIGGIGGTIQGAAVAGAPTGNGAAPEPLPAANVDMKKLVDDDTIKGDKNAPVTIVEFSDFECPFCGRFYEQTLPQIEEQYIKTGKVKLVYRDFPLSFHTQAQKAAEAAECAGEQGKFWQMHDKLFKEGVSGGVTAFKQYAADLKLDMEKFNSCLDSGQMANEIRKDFLDGQQAGVQGTPGFFVNGKVISGAQPFSVFQQIIEQELSS
ncbi:DsbA family protein [Candidatus Woesearchaeota archaeon]|nr:DsbA family protein [Candidatus Woesearchaeota archaeon]